MQKIVINRCYGGFGLSEAAIKRYAEIKGLTLYPDPPFDEPAKGPFGRRNYWTVPAEERMGKVIDSDKWDEYSIEDRIRSNEYSRANQIYDRNIDRADPALIQTVEELGDLADGEFAELKIVTIPDGVKWEVTEYDGMEQVEEVHSVWS